MRLDHLLSKEEEVGVLRTVESLREPAQEGRPEKMGKLAFADSTDWRIVLAGFAKRLRERSSVRWFAKNEQAKRHKISGVDALRGHTRSHPEHDG